MEAHICHILSFEGKLLFKISDIDVVFNGFQHQSYVGNFRKTSCF